MKRVEAKAKVKDRHRSVAANFQNWCETHPNAPIKKKIKAFDMIADAEARKK